jgi:hypothetical protein
LKTPFQTSSRAFARLIVAAALSASSLSVLAGLRTIPAEAPATTMTMNIDGTVVLGKRTVPLSPVAQIRDTENRIVLPTSLMSGPYKVRVLLNADGQLERAWILTGEEAAQPAPKF